MKTDKKRVLRIELGIGFVFSDWVVRMEGLRAVFRLGADGGTRAKEGLVLDQE